MALPLSGVRVLDFSRVLAGPYCTMLLGDLGAEIIKVEEPSRGDETREWGPPWAGDPADRMSAYYLCANRNKRSLTLNLKSDDGCSIARELACSSQVIIENFKPGSMALYGLGYPDLAALNPALVYCSITGFGQNGPYSEQPGYDFVIQALSGMMSITGPAEGAPCKVGVAITDVIAGLYAATSILAALRHAEATGQGQHLDVALLDTALAALVNVGSNALIGGAAPARYGNAHPNIVPYQTFEASDGAFAVAVGNDRQFAQLCQVVGYPGLSSDPRFATNPARVQHREMLVAKLGAAFALRTRGEWVSTLLAVGVPCGAVNTIPAILADPHVQARALIDTMTLATGAEARVIAMPVQFSVTPPGESSPPPQHGADTDALLRDVLGKGDDEILRLRQSGIV